MTAVTLAMAGRGAMSATLMMPLARRRAGEASCLLQDNDCEGGGREGIQHLVGDLLPFMVGDAESVPGAPLLLEMVPIELGSAVESGLGQGVVAEPLKILVPNAVQAREMA